MGIATLCTQARVSVTDIKKTLWLCSKLMDWKKVKILVTTFWGTSIVSSGPASLRVTVTSITKYFYCFLKVLRQQRLPTGNSFPWMVSAASISCVKPCVL